VIVRRDIFEIIEIPENTKIKLNEYEVKGYTIIKPNHTIIIDNKEKEAKEDSFNNLKKQVERKYHRHVVSNDSEVTAPVPPEFTSSTGEVVTTDSGSGESEGGTNSQQSDKKP